MAIGVHDRVFVDIPSKMDFLFYWCACLFLGHWLNIATIPA